MQCRNSYDTCFNCALNGVPVIETESFVKKRPKKQLIKMREIKSDYIVENGKREIYTYSHAADCFKLTEEDTVVVSDSIYCSLEGHKTEEVYIKKVQDEVRLCSNAKEEYSRSR